MVKEIIQLTLKKLENNPVITKLNFLEYQKLASLARSAHIKLGANPSNIVVIGYFVLGGTGS
jgi:hypothetical protein